ncbi:acid phosphatase type 7-like isoform X2 [Anneissia japonica]|uniref:acid phosphatase type 7-like isoform X2 n=1 Tax=Anneissia japonica TaxID=1529436 RepID=UPI001425578A|nr:acid phosphatase type 7-like isoform X2 [Anneissia japonica]
MEALMKRSIVAILLFFMNCNIPSLCSDEDISEVQPEQIHLSFTGNPTELMVTWSTENTTLAVVEYGQDRKLTLTAKGSTTKFINGGIQKSTQYIHRVKLTGLEPDKTYFYHCGSPDGWSEMFWFQSQPTGNKWSPKFAVYGDLGNVNSRSMGRLQHETQSGYYDAVLHVGDFAYDLDSRNGKVGDEFMRQIEPIAAYIPYMTCVGNHEERYNFSNYKNRFTMPNYEKTENLWYSWNIGPAHIIAFSTEVIFFQDYGKFLIDEQMKWLEQDLQEANKNRKEQPWIITIGHRPMYCSNINLSADCRKRESLIKAAFEDLFYKYGVDLEIYGHEHAYERLFPVYNRTVYNGSTDNPYTDPKAPVHIITGSPGNKELITPLSVKKMEWDAFRSMDYGYSRMHVLNETHLYFEQVSDNQDGKVIDKVMIIKNAHGPYN